jgi:hypothetical protein
VIREERPSGAEAHLHSRTFAARLKSCPDTIHSAGAKAHVEIPECMLMYGLKPAPFNMRLPCTLGLPLAFGASFIFGADSVPRVRA